MILFLLLSVFAKVLVIDDMNLTNKENPGANLNLLNNIKKNVIPGDGEIVLLNNEKKLRISSEDINKNVEIDVPIVERGSFSDQIEKYEKSLKNLKDVVNKTKANKNDLAPGFIKREEENTPERKNIDNFLQNDNYKKMEEMMNSFKNELFKNVPTKYSPISNNIPSNTKRINIPINPIVNNNPNNDIQNSYNIPLNTKRINIPIVNNNPNNELLIINPNDNGNSNSFLQKQIEDKLAYTKLKEQANLLKAIDNRKEYINMKLQEIKNNKDKLTIEMNLYKTKLENIINQIKTIKKAKDTLINKIRTNKNHIINLNKNSIQIIDRKEQVIGLIRITKNEVQRYRNLLENETNKLEMLEKQYEVYEQTLKKYNDEIDNESNKYNKTSNELNKSGIDLENLEHLFKEYNQKNKKMEEELKRYEKISACLDMEEKKVSRNQIGGFLV